MNGESFFGLKILILNCVGLKVSRDRYAFLAILTVAAIITPGQDILSLALVSLPLYLLYELSILIVRRSGSRKGGS